MRRGWMLVCLLLLLAACSPKRIFREPTIEPPPAEPPAPLTLGIAAAGLVRQQVGTPYRWGGHSPERGFDCSGLVQWTYGCLGVSLPRVVRDQRASGRAVQAEHVQPGDLVFFAIAGDRVSHVGVYVGDDEFVHAPRTGQPVRRDSLLDPYWRERLQAVRRVAAE